MWLLEVTEERNGPSGLRDDDDDDVGNHGDDIKLFGLLVLRM